MDIWLGDQWQNHAWLAPIISVSQTTTGGRARFGSLEAPQSQRERGAMVRPRVWVSRSKVFIKLPFYMHFVLGWLWTSSSITTLPETALRYYFSSAGRRTTPSLPIVVRVVPYRWSSGHVSMVEWHENDHKLFVVLCLQYAFRLQETSSYTWCPGTHKQSRHAS